MIRHARLGLLALASALLLLPATATATATASAATVVNGGFETGGAGGWNIVDQSESGGSWYVYSGTTSPLNGFAVPPPPQGKYAIMTDEFGPSSNVLYQDIALAPGYKYTLSMDVYYDSQAPIAAENTLDYTDSNPNQQYRIDVIKPTAPLTSLDPSNILTTVFATKDSDPETLTPTTVTADLSALAGQTVRLRIAQVDNESFMNAAVDNVQITSTPIGNKATVNTSAASGVSLTGATLNGTVNPGGTATTYHFEYGTTPSYGTSVPATDAAVGSDSSSHSVSQALSGLKPGSTYHFRLVATNLLGTVDGPDMTFTTNPVARISKVTQSHRRWRPGGKLAVISRKAPVGTMFKISLNTSTRVTLTFTQPGSGRKVGGKCVARTNHDKSKPRCTLTAGALHFNGRAGVNTVRFQGRVSHSRHLKPGTYTMVIKVATPGFAASTKRLTFTIVGK